MLLESTPINQAQIKNTGAVQEFNIKNSAKAFSILSSGLYANKIRAIVRELSCNAYDSHVAAGKADIPFEIHLPNVLEPWFSVKDFGTGLSVQEVQNIYSTYFESTKTNSNDFIGALGLGSKSPFSYTDNFSVTAIKNGIAGLFSCIINDSGIPSTVLMSTYETTEANGVEVKFSVNQRNDFDKFKNEAKEVLMYFPVKPDVKGCTWFTINEQTYVEKDILPGVSIISGYNSVAVMGNIAYNIDSSIIEKHLPDLANLLVGARLELKFNIGELDIQASREGLSYIPSTVEAFKNKLTSIRDYLETAIEKEIKDIDNTWEKVQYLIAKKKINLYSAAINSYVHNIGNNLQAFFDIHGSAKSLKVYTEKTNSNYNIHLQAFSANYRGAAQEVPSRMNYPTFSVPSSSPARYFDVSISPASIFLSTTKKHGIISKIKYNLKNKYKGKVIYLLTPADATKGMHLDDFYKSVYNPPVDQIITEADLEVKPKTERQKLDYVPVSILKYDYGNDKWNKAGLSTDYTDTLTYYYVPLKNTTLDESQVFKDVYTFVNKIKNTAIVELGFTLYGVRKSDIDNIKKKTNWVNAEVYVQEVLKGITKDDISKSAQIQSGLNEWISKYHVLNLYNIKNSKLEQAVKHYNFSKGQMLNIQHVLDLLQTFKIVNKEVYSYNKKFNKFQELKEELKLKYPMLCNNIQLEKDEADYVKAIDLYHEIQQNLKPL